MPQNLALPLPSPAKLRIPALALALTSLLAGAGCTDKACLESPVSGTGSASAATTGGGGMGGAGGGATGGGGASTGVDTSQSCPSREEAKVLLGTPSCAEAIDSVNSDGERDGNTCCYEVTTKSTACAREGAR